MAATAAANVAATFRSPVEVRATRNDDSTVSLPERVAAADGADFFVSLHHNAAEWPEARGFELFVRSDFEEADLDLARCLSNALTSTLKRWGIPKRGPRCKFSKNSTRGGIYVLDYATCPSSLVEVCFVTSPLELIAARESAFRNETAEAIARGLLRFGQDVLKV